MRCSLVSGKGMAFGKFVAVIFLRGGEGGGVERVGRFVVRVVMEGKIFGEVGMSRCV